jgi:predicted AAA+ superfamily ATPase
MATDCHTREDLMELINRPAYLSWLHQWRDRDTIKVVTGVRRCGKFTTLAMFAEQLAAEGVSREHIQTVNLEDRQFSDLSRDWKALHEYLTDRLSPDAANYVFIDEVHHVPEFQRLAASPALRPNVDLYLTGSTSELLSGDLATRLAGRYVETAMLPLSLREFTDGLGALHGDTHAQGGETLYRAYLETGGFPAALRLVDLPDMVNQYLAGILDTVLLRDVATRLRVVNTTALQDVSEFALVNIGSPISAKRIADTLTSVGRAVSRHTVETCLGGLTDARILYRVPQAEVRGPRIPSSPPKYYAVDTALRSTLLSRLVGDEGHVLENIVFLELVRRGWTVRTGRAGPLEVGFVAERPSERGYWQVAPTVRDPAILERELAPLRAIPDFHSRVLLTLDNDPPASLDRIRRVNAIGWLLGTD